MHLYVRWTNFTIKPSQDLKLKIGEVLDKWIPTTAEELKRIPICKGCKYKDCGVVVKSGILTKTQLVLPCNILSRKFLSELKFLKSRNHRNKAIKKQNGRYMLFAYNHINPLVTAGE